MRFLALILAGCLAAGEAAAGAWTLADGDGQVIMTTGRRIAPIGAFMGDVPEEDSNSVQIFVEYGVADGWTVGAALYADISATDLRDGEISLGGHLRHRIWTGAGGDVVALQAGGAIPVENWVLDDELAAQLTGAAPEIHLSVLYGRGWQWQAGNSFVSAATGFRWRGHDEADEWRVDITAGHEAWKGVMGLIGIHSTLPVIGEGESSLKIAPSIAWTMWPWLGPNDKKPYEEINPRTIQLGVVWDMLNPGDGLGVQVSVWQGF